jgi:WD40 repeat protein/transcriptional regulator with XRE-family HTH domain
MSGAHINIALDRFTTFGDLLKYLRRRAGFTQRELSIAVGYSDTQISRLEHNERLPDLATLTARFLPALDIEDEPEFAKRLLELAAAVRREDAPAAGLPPYKGLHYFDESDAELFFGREALTGRLLERLLERMDSNQRFLAIVGASGSGKSSIVRAGLIPALRWRPLSAFWPVFVITPTAHPLEALTAALQGESRPRPMGMRILDELFQHPEQITQALPSLAAEAGVDHVLVVIDQFEELFTHCRSAEEQEAFVHAVHALASDDDRIAAVVLVMRADFYSHCARFDHLRQLLSHYQEYIGPMTPDELCRAIVEPARQGHWELEDGLVDVMLHDVGADSGHLPEPGALPLLSHALLVTWQRRRGRLLTLSGYTASGGVRAAIAETAESVFYDVLDTTQREVARRIFLRLTELGDDASTMDTRRRVSLDELIPSGVEQATVQEVLVALADARIITTDQDTAEVAHEALIREWPTLRGWLEENREGLRLHRRLTEAAQEWDDLGRDAGVLFRGARLAQAAEWAAKNPEQINALERAFLDASQSLAEQQIREQEAQRQRELAAAHNLAKAERTRAMEQTQANERLRRRAVLLVSSLVIAALLGAAALVFGRRAQQAEQLATSRELAAAAITNLEVDAERSTLLALAALALGETLEARNALHQALPELHLMRSISAHEGGVPDVAFSPDGRRLVTVGAFDEFTMWDTNTGQPLFTVQDSGLEFGNSAAFSNNGRYLATAGVTRVIIWDAASGEKLMALEGESVGTTVGYNLGVGQISFSPDSRQLAVANMDGVSQVWDLAIQSVVLTLPPAGLPAKAMAYAPDGRFLATGGDEGIVTIWDAGDGTALYALTLSGIVHSVTFSPDGQMVAAASEDGSAKIWDAATGAELVNLPRLTGMYDLAFLADGRLATAGQDGVTRVWDGQTGQQVLSLASGASTVIGVAGSPDGARIATGSYDGRLRLWDTTPGHELLTISAHEGIAWDVAYHPAGDRFASAAVDGTVKLWDATNGRLLRTFTAGETDSPGFTGLAFSSDGNQMAAGGVDGTITVWDSATGLVVQTLTGHTTYVTGLSFSADGARLASACWDGTAKVWDLARGEEITTFHGHTAPVMITNVVFHPDGRSVLTGGDDDFVRQWDAVTGEEIRVFSGVDKDILGLALSPDGEMVASGDQDGQITLWSVASGEKLRTFGGHAGLLLRLAFNADGTRLSSAGFDRLAKVWDVDTGAELASLYGQQSNVFGVAFSPVGNILVTAGADGTVRTYTLQLEELVALARSRLTRNLTLEECQKFLHAGFCPDS